MLALRRNLARVGLTGAKAGFLDQVIEACAGMSWK